MSGKWKILIVEDDQLNQKVVKGMLEDTGYRCILAANGIEGLEQLKEHEDIQLILLDWAMPEMDGLEMLKRVRLQAKHRSLPIIMLTAYDRESDVVRAREAGATDYLIKPFEDTMLIEKIRKAILNKKH